METNLSIFAARHSHQHGPQLQEVVVLRVLHLHHSPGVQAAPHLLPLGLDLLVGSHHCKWDTGLGKKIETPQNNGVDYSNQ